MREKLTASLIAKLQVPEGKKLVKIHDTEVRGLCVRMMASGMASFVFIEKANTSDICRHPILAVEMLNPNYFEKYKCSDNTLKLIVSELKPLSSCLFPSQPKADFDWGSVVVLNF